MTKQGTWRVVVAGGEVRSVAVTPPPPDHIPLVDGGGYVARSDCESSHHDGYSAREAVALLVAQVMCLEVAEILAPGELTRAEAIAALIGEVEAMRPAYEMVVCGGFVVDDIVRRLRGEPEPELPTAGEVLF